MLGIYRFLNSFWFFLLILGTFLSLHLYLNYGVTAGDLSSDIWMVQYVEIQEHESPWSYVPPSYNQERFYLAYPIFYFLNPGLDGGMLQYHLVAIFLIIATYIITGWVFFKIFGNWIFAALVALLFLIPHNVFLTNIGMLGFRNFRGLALVFPLYALLSYYWILFGIERKWQNIFLAVLAAFSVYLYPPFGVIIVPLLIVVAFIVRGKIKWREIALFSLLYLILAIPFWYGHFSNQNSGMLDLEHGLTATELQTQAEIVDYIIPDGSLRIIELGTLKRTIWDSFPLILIFFLSLFLYSRVSSRLEDRHKRFFKVTLLSLGVLLTFVGTVEIINYWLYTREQPPIFLEHLRLLRFAGFLLIAQAIFTIYIINKFFGKKVVAVAIALALIFSPLAISAPLVRALVRRVTPESIREKYNLAPLILPQTTLSYRNLEQSALWARANLNQPTVKMFVFDDVQKEFQFKIISRLNTNLTNKEGSIWITSGFKNSTTWYAERKEYDTVINSANHFSSVLEFAHSLDSTHMLLPRGRFSELYDQSNLNLPVVYSNSDYHILELHEK